MAMEVREFETVSRHGTAIQQLYLEEASPARGLTVLFPGQAYSCERPLLHFARLAALEAGHAVLCLQYGFQAARKGGPDGDFEPVAEEASQAIAWAMRETSAPALTFVAKSMGTFAAARVLGKNPALGARLLLLTPVEGAAALVASHGAHAVIGTADPFYDRPGIRSSIETHPTSWTVLDGLDHSLQVEGDVTASLWGLSRTVEITQNFLGETRP